MFDFTNLDSIDDEGAEPEWLRWKRRPASSRKQLAILEDEREEQFAAGEDEYVYEKLEVPFLPEEGAFDPMGLFDDSTDAIEDRIAAYNGQVIMNMVSSSYEQHMLVEQQKEERKAYIEAVHNQRLAVLETGTWRERQERLAAREKGTSFDRKPFGWRDLHSPLIGNVVGLPDGGTFAEYVFSSNSKLVKSLTKVRGTVFLPTAGMIQVLCSMGHLTRPQPSGPRIRSNAPWHLALTDVFFPTPFIVDDGSEYVDKQDEAPTLVHVVCMSVNKETGEIEAKHLLENVKFQGHAKYPKRSGLRS